MGIVLLSNLGLVSRCCLCSAEGGGALQVSRRSGDSSGVAVRLQEEEARVVTITSRGVVVVLGVKLGTPGLFYSRLSF